jgi:hypothetical protein
MDPMNGHMFEQQFSYWKYKRKIWKRLNKTLTWVPHSWFLQRIFYINNNNNNNNNNDKIRKTKNVIKINKRRFLYIIETDVLLNQ